MLNQELQKWAPNTPEWDCSCEPRSGSQPCCIGMLVAAIENGQVEIVKFWLAAYRSTALLANWDVLGAITRNFNSEIAELFHRRNMYWKDTKLNHWESFLSAVCYEGPKALPIVRFLLDKGANVREGAFLDGRAGAVSPALKTGFPIEIIEEMIDRGARIGATVFRRELKNENVKALKLFIERERIEPSLSSFLKDEEILDIAHNTNNRELILLMESYLYKKNSIGTKDSSKKDGGTKETNSSDCNTQIWSKITGWWRRPTLTVMRDIEEREGHEVQQDQKESPWSSLTNVDADEIVQKTKY